MSKDTPIERRGDDFVLHLEKGDGRYLVSVSKELISDEIGDGFGEKHAREWIAANLQNIFGAATARLTGGFVKEPWGRVVVEELP